MDLGFDINLDAEEQGGVLLDAIIIDCPLQKLAWAHVVSRRIISAELSAQLLTRRLGQCRVDGQETLVGTDVLASATSLIIRVIEAGSRGRTGTSKGQYRDI